MNELCCTFSVNVTTWNEKIEFGSNRATAKNDATTATDTGQRLTIVLFPNTRLFRVQHCQQIFVTVLTNKVSINLLLKFESRHFYRVHVLVLVGVYHLFRQVAPAATDCANTQQCSDHRFGRDLLKRYFSIYLTTKTKFLRIRDQCT